MRMRLMETGVFDETHRLRCVADWTPGLETLVGQTLPPEISLFFDYFDVIKGQEEHEKLIEMLEKDLGVKTINFRDIYVETLQPVDIKPETLQKMLLKQCEKYMRMSGRKIDTNLIEVLLNKDIKRYGEERAVALNLELCIGLPLCNMYFMRDVATVILNGIFTASFRYPIRRPEVSIVEKTLKHLGVGTPVKIPTGYFEGGDAIVHHGNILFGKGMRTDDTGALKMLEAVRKYVFSADFQFFYNFLIIDMPEKMETMHLDTIFMPLNYNTVIVCPEIAKKCSVLDVHTAQRYNFYEYLKKSYGCDIITVTKKEQELTTVKGSIIGDATNILVIDKERLVVPLSSNKLVNQKLKEYGFKLYYADIYNLLCGFGGPHCMFLQLSRAY